MVRDLGGNHRDGESSSRWGIIIEMEKHHQEGTSSRNIVEEYRREGISSRGNIIKRKQIPILIYYREANLDPRIAVVVTLYTKILIVARVLLILSCVRRHWRKPWLIVHALIMEFY